jgi:hypothetical protein
MKNALLWIAATANFTRNTILPFHGGAARWYNNNAVAGSLRGD